MTTLAEKLAYFKEKQAEISAAVAEFKAEGAAITAEYNKKLEEVREAGEMKIREARKRVDRLLEPYKAEQRAMFGTASGDTADLVSTVELVMRVVEAMKS